MGDQFTGNAYRYFLIWGICSSLSVSLCTIVDALLVGNLIGSDGLAITNISTPVFLIYSLFGITIGVGANVYVGRLLGASKVEEANHTFHVQLTLGVVIGLILLLPLLFKEKYFAFLGVTEELYPLAEQYLTVVMWSAPVFVLYNMLSISVRVDSDPKLSAAASGVVIIVNIVLDLLLMKGLKVGIVGASASLCIAEFLGLLVLLVHFVKKRSLLRLNFALPKMKDIRHFVANGFGIGSANIFGAVVMLSFNTLLLRFDGEIGALYVALYGVIYTISSIPVAVFDGASSALSTVSAFFIGESDPDSIMAVLKKAIITVIFLAGGLTLLCMVFAEPLVRFFGIQDEVFVANGITAIHLFSLSILFMSVNTTVTGFWQSIGRAKLAGVMSVLRNCLMMLGIGIVVIPEKNILGLSMTYVVTEVICVILVLTISFFSGSKKYVVRHYSPTGRCFEGNYIIQTESMQEILGDLERIWEEWEIGMKEAFFVNFVCEEILINIIKFGDLNQKKKYYMSIKVMEKDGDFILRIRDNCRLYNPFESKGDEIDQGVLNFIQASAKYCDYQRKMIFNYLYTII